MIRKSLLLLLACIFFFSANAQTEDDNIEFLRVRNQLKEGNYRKAIAILNGISEGGKTSTFYLSYSADCYEKLKAYDTAAIFYKKLYGRTKDFVAMQKVAEMKDRQDAKLSCELCHGSGYYSGEQTCLTCRGNGKASKPCEDFIASNGSLIAKGCKGSGECVTCNGTGRRRCRIMGTDDYFDCDCYCENTGKCRRCKGAGKLMENCTACYGLGKITKTMYCNH